MVLNVFKEVKNLKLSWTEVRIQTPASMKVQPAIQ
jgi:hypothetical protein